MPSVLEPDQNLSDREVWSVEDHVIPAASACTEFDALPGFLYPQQHRRVHLGRGYGIEIPPNAPPWIFQVLPRLKHLLTLGPNWDSYGARPIEPMAVFEAIYFLHAAMPCQGQPPQIVPTVSGGLQLEWHTGVADLEVEVDAQGRYELSFESGSGGVQEHAGRAVDPHDAKPFVAAVSG